MNQSRAGFVASLCEALRKERINCDTRNWVKSLRVLFDDAYTVNYHVWMNQVERPLDAFRVFSCYAPQCARRIVNPESRVSCGRLAEGHMGIKARRETLPELMT